MSSSPLADLEQLLDEMIDQTLKKAWEREFVEATAARDAARLEWRQHMEKHSSVLEWGGMGVQLVAMSCLFWLLYRAQAHRRRVQNTVRRVESLLERMGKKVPVKPYGGAPTTEATFHICLSWCLVILGLVFLVVSVIGYPALVNFFEERTPQVWSIASGLKKFEVGRMFLNSAKFKLVALLATCGLTPAVIFLLGASHLPANLQKSFGDDHKHFLDDVKKLQQKIQTAASAKGVVEPLFSS